MIRTALVELDKWDGVEYAAGYRARLSAIPEFEGAHHCWRSAGMMPTRRCLSWPATGRLWQRAEKTTIRRPGAYDLTLAAMRE